MNFEFRQHPIRLKTVIFSIIISIAIGTLIVLAAGSNPIEVYSILFKGAVGSVFAVSSTLRWMTPILLTGTAAAFAFRGGMFNIGTEGQLYIGAFASAWAGFTFQGLPVYLHIPLCLLFGIIGGMLFALIPALLRRFYNANEMVTGLMLNYVAIYFTDYLVRYHFIAGGTHGTTLITETISEAAMLPTLFQKGQANAGLFVGLAAIIFFWIIIKKSKLGYEIHITGINPDFARYGGVDVAKTQLKVMLISGAIAGLGGAVEVMGILDKFQTRFSPDFGTDGIVAAFLGGNTPVGTLIGALVMGFIKAGVLSVERYTDVSRSLAMIIQAIILTFISTKVFSNYSFKKLFQKILKKGRISNLVIDASSSNDERRDPS